MQVHQIPFEKTGKFPKLFLDYINQEKKLKEFYDLFPAPENFLKKAASYNFSLALRNELAEVLLKQYKNVPAKDSVLKNIDALRKNNSFTITTGHQLSLFTGPLYFIYKIISVIKVSQELNRNQKEISFVPVFWMASEDHDFEEVNHFFLFNKKYSWETDQQGPVGRFEMKGTERIFSEIKEDIPAFKKAYSGHQNLAEATRYLINELFGNTGLVIIDGDEKDLKKYFAPLIKEELLKQESCRMINKQSEMLEKLGYSSQVKPREINLFYIEKGVRERIVKEGNTFRVLNTDIAFSEKEILELADSDPEKFSPNVVLRPLYQQMLLPNIAYCGGPAEISYWLQLKSLFDHHKINYPVLLPRVSAQIISAANRERMNKWKIDPEDIFLPSSELKKKVLGKISGKDLSLDKEEKELCAILDKISVMAKEADPTLEGFVEAERKNILKSLSNIEKKIRKAEEQKNESSFAQLNNFLEKMFPDNLLQERRDNFLNFYLNDSEFIVKLTDCIAPFDYRFNIIFHG
jgi:bacillithiol biosynthesis cysteine-adding enzyme BshC